MTAQFVCDYVNTAKRAVGKDIPRKHRTIHQPHVPNRGEWPTLGSKTE